MEPARRPRDISAFPMVLSCWNSAAITASGEGIIPAVRVRLSICIYIYINLYMYIYIYNLYMYICIYVYMYTCIYAYMFICIYVYMYICMYCEQVYARTLHVQSCQGQYCSSFPLHA